MEKRAALAFALSVLLLLAYLWVMETFFTPHPRTPTPAERTAGAERPSETAAPAAPGAPAPVAALPAAAPRPPHRTVAVSSPLFRAVVSSEGGKLEEWTLHYRGDKPMVVGGELGPRGLVVGQDVGTAQPVPMAVVVEPGPVGGDRGRTRVELMGELGDVRLWQTLEFSPETYALEVTLRAENRAPEARALPLAWPWVYRHHAKAGPERFHGQRPTEVVWGTDRGIERVEDLRLVGRRDLEARWIALGSTWYLAALIPRTQGFKLHAAVAEGGVNGEYQVVVAARAAPTLLPGGTWEGRLTLYVGPKEYERLERYGLEGTVNFGGFPLPKRYGGLPMEWLGVPILKFMTWLYGFVRNYGVVIIILTVISKALFYPLTVKSMRSMKAMQALQPQINALRSKYKNDPRRLQEETLALYRRHRVNPMGGCLPMLAQIPVFYALYLALSVSVELQNAPFLCFGRLFGLDLWICDLASHDPTYVLPILMGISMFIQQKMTPVAGDPRQAKMMLIMPFIFTFMFLNLPSGLVLYWFVSNLLQILQQWWMDRAARGPREPVGGKA
jgi:YidC/Oxa1 family membrane protein insertase